MNISLEYLERCAADSGFQIGPLEKVARLGELASHIARHPVLGKSLALKGGTALNLCFSPPKRLSVDLDFNYIGHIEREKMLEDRPRIEMAVLENHIDDRTIDEKLRPLIAGNPPLKAKELVHKAWAVVGPFLELTPHEKEYLQKIQEGVLQPEILFPDALEESAKFADHPAILWKITNVRSHLKARKSREGKHKA
jgi:hypothetical protein